MTLWFKGLELSLKCNKKISKYSLQFYAFSFLMGCLFLTARFLNFSNVWPLCAKWHSTYGLKGF